MLGCNSVRRRKRPTEGPAMRCNLARPRQTRNAKQQIPAHCNYTSLALVKSLTSRPGCRRNASVPGMHPAVNTRSLARTKRKALDVDENTIGARYAPSSEHPVAQRPQLRWARPQSQGPQWRWARPPLDDRVSARRRGNTCPSRPQQRWAKPLALKRHAAPANRSHFARRKTQELGHHVKEKERTHDEPPWM